MGRHSMSLAEYSGAVLFLLVSDMRLGHAGLTTATPWMPQDLANWQAHCDGEVTKEKGIASNKLMEVNCYGAVALQ
jgi:hypothetical protein